MANNSGLNEVSKSQIIEFETMDNTKQKVIRIPKDRLKNNTRELMDYNKDIFSYLVLSIGLVVPVIQDSFTPILGIPRDGVKWIFIIFFVLSVFCLLHRILLRLHNKYLSIDDFLELCEDNEAYKKKNFITRLCLFFKNTFKNDIHK